MLAPATEKPVVEDFNVNLKIKNYLDKEVIKSMLFSIPKIWDRRIQIKMQLYNLTNEAGTSNVTHLRIFVNGFAVYNTSSILFNDTDAVSSSNN